MKPPIASILFFAPLLLSAQSLLGRLPYRPSEPAVPRNPLLDTRSALQAMDPLPEFDIPRELPAEFRFSEAEQARMDMLREANRHLSEGSPEKAVDIYREFLAIHPDEIQVRVAYADSLFAMDKHKAAERQYLEVLRHYPMHFQALNNLAWMYASVRDPDIHQPERALELARRAKVNFINSHHVWSTLSQAHYELGMYAKGAQSARNAIQLAEQSRASTRILVNYLMQHDKCRVALEATSLLE